MRRFGRTDPALAAAIVLVVVAISWGVTRFLAPDPRVETAEIASVLRLTPGSRVADVGAGEGNFTVELARVVTSTGHVFATEIDLENLTAIRRAVVEAGLQNVTVVKAEEAATGLPEACCDAAFLRGVYHHLTEPTATAAGLFMALRPSGHLAIIDFLPSRWLSIFFPTTGVPSNRGGHGIQPEIIIEELTAAGFVLDRRIDAWRGGNYCLVFRRPEH